PPPHRARRAPARGRRNRRLADLAPSDPPAMLLCPARKVGAGGKDGPHMLWLIVGIVIGMVVALAALRPRLAEVGVLRRERDQYANEASRLEGNLESERALAADRFKSLSADALKQNNEQFLTLAKQALGTYQ